MRRFTRRGDRDVAGQLRLEWSGAPSATRVQTPTPMRATVPEPMARPSKTAVTSVIRPTSPRADGLTLRLKWDFSSTFPQPTEQAIDAGVIQAEDAEPENVKIIHEEHAREMLANLNDLDVVLDCKRRGVHPGNLKAPTLEVAKERLQKFFQTEPARLEQSYQNLLAVYCDVFGDEAADAFDKAVRAWHAGIEVVDESKPATEPNMPAAPAATLPPAPTQSSPTEKPARQRHADRVTARLPVPRPLATAVAAGHFGHEEDGKPVRPCPREVRDITEDHAEKLVNLLDDIACAPANGNGALRAAFAAGIAAFAEDFGERAAQQLEAYVTRQGRLDSNSRHGR